VEKRLVCRDDEELVLTGRPLSTQYAIFDTAYHFVASRNCVDIDDASALRNDDDSLELKQVLQVNDCFFRCEFLRQVAEQERRELISLGELEAEDFEFSIYIVELLIVLVK